MNSITIGRYKPCGRKLPENVSDVADHFAGWIEGVRDDGSSWIMWLDAVGNPVCFYGKRDDGGGVEGDPIDLSPVT